MQLPHGSDLTCRRSKTGFSSAAGCETPARYPAGARGHPAGGIRSRDTQCFRKHAYSRTHSGRDEQENRAMECRIHIVDGRIHLRGTVVTVTVTPILAQTTNIPAKETSLALRLRRTAAARPQAGVEAPAMPASPKEEPPLKRSTHTRNSHRRYSAAPAGPQLCRESAAAINAASLVPLC